MSQNGLSGGVWCETYINSENRIDRDWKRKPTPTRHKKSKKFDLVCCALFLVKQVCALRHILLVNYVLINYSWSCNPDHWHTHRDITMHDTILWWQSTHGLKSNLCRVEEQPKIEVQLNSITPKKVLSPSQYILHRLQHRHYTHTQYTTIILNNSRQIIDYFMWWKFQLFSIFLFPFFFSVQNNHYTNFEASKQNMVIPSKKMFYVELK